MWEEDRNAILAGSVGDRTDQLALSYTSYQTIVYNTALYISILAGHCTHKL